jgi:hypothetical protein
MWIGIKYAAADKKQKGADKKPQKSASKKASKKK